MIAAIALPLVRSELPCAAQEAAEPPAVSAPSAEAERPASYERAIDQAVDEHERGHFEEAREHFRAAHEIFPNARTLRGLGKVEFELRNYGESVKFLGAALSSEVRPLDAELRAEVEALLERARAYVGEVHVAVQPGTATVSVDGVPVASGPHAALALLVGDHLLEFHADGRQPERRRIRVRGREQINIQVALGSAEHDARSAQSMERSERAPVYRKWWLWTAVGAVVAGSAVAIALTAGRDESEGRLAGGTSGVVVPNP